MKLSSAPPDRMRTLENEDPPVELKIKSPSSGVRAKTSMETTPRVSLATKRRMENKLAIQPSPSQEKERELRQRRIVEQEFKDACMVIRANAEWNEVSEALLTIQKTISLRPDLVLDCLHDLTLSLVNQVHNLRSSVAKTAVACFNDMFIKLEKHMDADLDMTVGAILKKIGESGFLVDEAIKCLSTMAKHVTNTRAITALLGSADHKNSAIRLRISILLQTVITSFPDAQASRYVASFRDMEKLLPILVKFLREGLADSRNAAKRSLYFLSKYPDFEKVVMKTLSSSQIREIQEAIEFIRNREELAGVPTDEVGRQGILENLGN